MSVFGALGGFFGGAAAEGVKGTLEGAGGFLKDIRTAITGVDPETKGKIELHLAQLEGNILSAQAEINKIEAGSSRLFVAGWRPFIGWVSGSAFAYHFIVQPVASFVIGVYAWQLPPLPTLDMGALMTVLMGMLGLSGLRTYEKVHGAQDKH